jgi:hypothetical protein
MSEREIRWIPDDDPEAAWFAVRNVFRRGDSYEERITLWKAPTFEEAEHRAQIEIEEYAETVEMELLHFAQVYRLAEYPQDGAEVFSLIRRSELESEEYLSTFFDTGTEHQRTMKLD